MATKPDPKAIKLSKTGEKHRKMLLKAGHELTGDESEADLETMCGDAGLLSDSDDGPIEIEGVPNKVDVTHETIMMDGKPRNYGVFAVHPITSGPHKGEFFLVNEKGVRVSPPSSANRIFGRAADDPRGTDIKTKEVGEISEYAHIAKAAARSNVERRARRLPNDKE